MLKRILVVEGKDIERQGLVSILSQAGYDVMACMDVVSAARAIGGHNDFFDLLVVNTAVGNTAVKDTHAYDGISFIRFIGREHNGLIPPVLVISKSDASEAVSAIPGVVDFLIIPFIANTLLERVQRILIERERVSQPDLQARMKQVLNGSPEIPTLPEMRLEVVQMTARFNERDPYKDVAVKQVAAKVRLDPPLCGHLISRANRVLVRGQAGDVKTALEAVSRLGLQQVHSIAVATSVLELTRTASQVPGFDPKKLWVHSVACAANTQVIGQHLRLDRGLTESAFTAGILHDIGKIMVCKFFPDWLAAVLDLMRKKRCAMAMAEQEIGGITHATLGAQLAQRWRLSSVLVGVIASHHAAGSRGGSELGKMTSIVQVADAVSYQLGMGFGLVRVMPLINPEALRSLGLQAADIDGLKPTMLESAKNLVADLPFQMA